MGELLYICDTLMSRASYSLNFSPLISRPSGLEGGSTGVVRWSSGGVGKEREREGIGKEK